MTLDPQPPESSQPVDGRERCLRTAYDLFCRHGVQTIGIDRIIAEAQVAKMTLYRHFGSKDELVLAVLDRREEVWTTGWLAREMERRGTTPAERLLAMFDAFDEWFRREDYEGCLFINTMLEIRNHASPVGARAALGVENVRKLILRHAKGARVRDPELFSWQWHMLLYGAITMASSGYVDAARRAHELGARLLQAERAGATAGSGARSSG
jgi:AcrR family transcriptional regulator